MEIRELISYENTRKNIYKTLSELYCLPDENLPDRLDIISKSFSKISSNSLSCINLMQTEIDRNFDITQLKIEFTRLFVGPFGIPAPPYGSIYLENERKIMGDSTMDAKNRYEKFGLEMSEKFKDVPDHISVELEYMFFLIFKEVESIKSSDPENVQVYISEQKSFLQNHLNMWIPDFTNCVSKFSENLFYINLSKLIFTFINEDTEYLNKIHMPAESK